MNDIDKMPPKCHDCRYWERCKPPFVCGYFISSMWDHPYHGAGRIVNCYTDPLKACWEFGEHYQQNPENWIVGGKGDIVAWMPLPEPWGGDTE